MNEEKRVGRVGRPTEHTEGHKRTTIELPVSLIEYLATVKPNRTKWVIEAIQEKREREDGTDRYESPTCIQCGEFMNSGFGGWSCPNCGFVKSS